MAKLVVDTNILFRFFRKGSKIRLLAKYFDLYTPAYTLFELYEKKEKIVLKLKIPEPDYYEIYFSLRFIINFIPEIYYLDKWQKALEIANQFDPKDTPFIALALKLKLPIWTNDRKMIEYGLRTEKYLALDTQAVEELLQGKSLENIKDNLKNKYLKT